jgi:hypothetical protein
VTRIFVFIWCSFAQGLLPDMQELPESSRQKAAEELKKAEEKAADEAYSWRPRLSSSLIRNFILMGLEPKLQTRLYEDFWRPMEQDFGQEAYGSHDIHD